MGHDISKFRHVPYSNYSKLVYDYTIILRGYPLTEDNKLI